MTGGVVAVLGETGKNFAAGMSGGVAYVYDPDDEFAAKANTGMVSLHDDLEEKDERMLRRLVENHVAYTGSGTRATAARELGARPRVVREDHARGLLRGDHRAGERRRPQRTARCA